MVNTKRVTMTFRRAMLVRNTLLEKHGIQPKGYSYVVMPPSNKYREGPHRAFELTKAVLDDMDWQGDRDRAVYDLLHHWSGVTDGGCLAWLAKGCYHELHEHQAGREKRGFV